MLEISAGSRWSPEDWVYYGLIGELGKRLGIEFEAYDEYSYADLSLAGLEPEAFAPYARAVREIVRDDLAREPLGNEYWAHAVYGRSLLAALLEADPRAGVAPAAPVELVIAPGVRWRGPRLAVEHLAARAWFAELSLVAPLLAGTADLSALAPGTFRGLLPAIEWIRDHYDDPALAELVALMDADPRTRPPVTRLRPAKAWFFAPGSGPARTWQDHAIVVPHPPARRLGVFTAFYRGFKVPGKLLDDEPALDEEFLVRDTIVLEGGISAIVHIAREPRRWEELVSIGLADAFTEGHFEAADGRDPFDENAIAEQKLRNMLHLFANASEPYWHGFRSTMALTPYTIPLWGQVNKAIYESGDDTPALQARIRRLLEE